MSNSAPRKAPQAAAKQTDPGKADTETADAGKADTGKAEAQPAGSPPSSETSETSGTSGTSGTSETHDAKPDMDEVKRKFREALDRKHEMQAEGSGAGGRDNSKIHGAHGPADHRRTFRRKSG